MSKLWMPCWQCSDTAKLILVILVTIHSCMHASQHIGGQLFPALFSRATLNSHKLIRHRHRDADGLIQRHGPTQSWALILSSVGYIHSVHPRGQTIAHIVVRQGDGKWIREVFMHDAVLAPLNQCCVPSSIAGCNTVMLVIPRGSYAALWLLTGHDARMWGVTGSQFCMASLYKHVIAVAKLSHCTTTYASEASWEELSCTKLLASQHERQHLGVFW
jgi:hypothetical protein